MKSILIISALISFLPIFAFSHEGHNEGLAQVQALHGGVPKEGKLFHIEVVTEGKVTKIYILPHKGDQITIADITMKATIDFPKSAKKKSIEPNIKTEGDHFVFEAETSGTNRYSLSIKASLKGKPQNFKLNVEPMQ